MAEIVLEIVTLGFERVERFVLHLPARAATGGHLDDVGAINGQIGDEAVAISHLAVRTGNLDGQPIDPQGIRAVAQGQIAHPTIGVTEALFAALDGLDKGVEFDAGQIFAQRGMGLGLADEQKMAGGGEHGLADRLAGVEIIAQIDGVEMRETRPMGGKPAPAGAAFAILLFA